MSASYPGVDSADERQILAAEGLYKRFGHVTVLEPVDFSIRKGEKVCVIGPSGSGKTTLLRCLNLLVEPTGGRLYFHNRLVGSWSPNSPKPNVKLSEHRRRIGMVFQHFELFPHLSALDNVALGPRHVLHEPLDVARDRALSLLDRVGLRDFADARPATLSGGQKQRVAIARALAMTPDLILFDEPTSALDAEMVDEVLTLMTRLASDGMTMIIVTHELRFARDVADRVVVMEQGRVLEEGPTETMFGAPSHPRVRRILRL